MALFRNFISIICVASLLLSCSKRTDMSLEECSTDSLMRISILEKLDDCRYDLDLNRRLWAIDTRNFNFDGVIKYALPCYEHALMVSDEDMKLYSGIYLSQAYLFKSKVDTMFLYLNPIAPLVEKSGDQKVKTMYNNILGIYYMGFSMDINKAIDYLQQSLLCAGETQNPRSSAAVMSNIVYAYFLRDDPGGLQYALKIYDMGIEENDDYILYLGALSAAHMFYIKGDFDEALAYIEETELLKNKLKTKNNTTFPLYGEILFRLGGKANVEKGEYYIQEALKHINDMDNSGQIYTYLVYGKHLMETGEYAKAVEALNTGISKTYSYKNYSLYTATCRMLSDIYDRLGMHDKAESNRKKYMNTRDSLFNVDNERMFNNLRFRFESERLNNIIKGQQISILEREKQKQLLLLTVIIILIMLVMTYVMYRRKNIMYQRLVKLYDSYNVSLGKDNSDKYKELYGRLMELMDNAHIYRRNDISMDVLADLLSTNKSYLSRMFSYYNTSFNAFINSRRIKECTEILSENPDEVNFKSLSSELGFNSMSSFYRAFQNETGVPPAQYRKYKKMQKNLLSK